MPLIKDEWPRVTAACVEFSFSADWQKNVAAAANPIRINYDSDENRNKTNAVKRRNNGRIKRPFLNNKLVWMCDKISLRERMRGSSGRVWI